MGLVTVWVGDWVSLSCAVVGFSEILLLPGQHRRVVRERCGSEEARRNGLAGGAVRNERRGPAKLHTAWQASEWAHRDHPWRASRAARPKKRLPRMEHRSGWRLMATKNAKRHEGRALI